MSRFEVSFRDKLKQNMIIVADGFIQSPAMFEVTFFDCDLDGRMVRTYVLWEVESVRKMDPNE